ncbi:hypothetical protein [Salinispora tropica]|uniref:Adenylate kinase n=1 Tax=Salinispora tropica (strain ATCC BAA-916 / DSM 44818 / JCM 13857 / NBRC 105044 / CNB-440) TaxID=369723 RepID=A4X6E4_SALTO|nr:hypothetical protein [Salinispora tropica]ABP54444.1 hypothetical protein Strop_1990 [Salinispora tropica CNB-440]
MPGFVALTGPPAVGKTTLSAQLAAVHGAQVFRLREFAQGFRHRPDADPALFATEDPLGWFSDQTVRVLLDVALLGREPTGVTVLENLPGTVNQLRTISEIGRRLGLPVMVIELTAPDTIVIGRSLARRVCPACEPDLDADPHRPAGAAAADFENCVTCGNRLLRRRCDGTGLYELKLRRFRSRIPGIRREAATLDLPYQAVNATASPADCLRRVVAALRSTQILPCLPADVPPALNGATP